jgi:type VI secretion system protein ImpC
MPNIEGLELELNLTEGPTVSARKRRRAMRLLVLGDFTGRSNDVTVQSDPGIHQRPIVQVDVDNLEDVLRRFAPRLEIAFPDGGGAVELTFRSLDDFRPELLYERAPVFGDLRQIRERLLDPTAFESAAAELQSLLGSTPLGAEAKMGAEEVAAEAPAEDDAQTIERLLGKPASGLSEARSEMSQEAQTAVSALIRRAVAPHVVSNDPPHRDLYLRALDEAVAERMRRLLHAPAFQALEANWLSLHRLLTNLETDEGLHIHLLDVSRQELAADLASAGRDLKASGIYRLLVEGTGTGTPGGEPWSLLVGSLDFGASAADLALLASLGLIAASAGGPFLAAASPGLLGSRSLAETPDPSDWDALPPDAEAAWNALRATPIAPWVGLAMSRVLLRLPYGKDTDPVDAFEFDELGAGRLHEDYLWGNPAFACALLIGQAYSARGWSMAPGDMLDLGDLPAHIYEAGGEKRLQACAEAYLTERAASAMLDRGIMPLLSFKGRNLVRLARFQSIASPPAALMGSWRG